MGGQICNQAKEIVSRFEFLKEDATLNIEVKTNAIIVIRVLLQQKKMQNHLKSTQNCLHHITLKWIVLRKS